MITLNKKLWEATKGWKKVSFVDGYHFLRGSRYTYIKPFSFELYKTGCESGTCYFPSFLFLWWSVLGIVCLELLKCEREKVANTKTLEEPVPSKYFFHKSRLWISQQKWKDHLYVKESTLKQKQKKSCGRSVVANDLYCLERPGFESHVHTPPFFRGKLTFRFLTTINLCI